MNSNTNSNKFDDYIDTHPRQCLLMLVFGLTFIWQSIVAVIGLGFFLLVKKYPPFRWWMALSIGAMIAMITFYFSSVTFVTLVHNGLNSNITFWRQLFNNEWLNALASLQLSYLLGYPILMAGVLSTIDLIPGSPYENEINALNQGQHNKLPEKSEKDIAIALKKIRDEEHDGTVLGISKYTGKCSVIADRDINQVLLVLGTTGSGKTITLRRFYQRAITKGYPLIIVDGKPDSENIAWLMRLAEDHGRQFLGFNCGNRLPYDPLANGGYTELKDKIISLKDEWSSDHYRSIAEDYLQATFEVLLRSKKEFDLKRVVQCLNFTDLILLAREINDPDLMKRVKSLEQYDRSDITGLQAHLNILIHSELGQYFEKNESTFNLADAIQKNAVVYFALPALRFPSFSKVLGKLVINDLKAVIDRHNSNGKRIFTVFDEFSVFAGEQVLNLVNMGRGKGVHAIFGTQGLADLERVSGMFKSQVLNCANTLICHQLNDQESAEGVANWVGTKDVFTVTAQINIKQRDAAMGSVRRNKEFIVHTDDIKQGLQVGEVFYITKVGRFLKDKVRIKFVQ